MARRAFCGLWTIIIDYEHNLSHYVFLTYLQNSQISPNSSKFCSFLAKSERFKRLQRRRRTDGRTHTLFKFEARLHKKPFGQLWSIIHKKPFGPPLPCGCKLVFVNHHKMKAVIWKLLMRGGYMNSKVRRFLPRAPRDLKSRFLAVHGLYFTNLLEFLKNLNFGGLGVFSKTKITLKTTISHCFSLIDL